MIIEPAPVELLHNVITLPEFNIFAIQLGSFGVRWYALAYIAGLLIGIYILHRILAHMFSPTSGPHVHSRIHNPHSHRSSHRVRNETLISLTFANRRARAKAQAGLPFTHPKG